MGGARPITAATGFPGKDTKLSGSKDAYTKDGVTSVLKATLSPEERSSVN